MLVNTSENEGWGLTVLEANACGVPTVACDVPGLRDAVVPGKTGVLVPHGDVEQLTAAIARLLTVEGERQQLADGARLWALQFSWEHSAAAITEVIEALPGVTPETAALGVIDTPPRRSVESSL